MNLRSLLFVPGDSDKKLAKGADSGADALILDIEDSVAPARKPLAREMVRDYLAAQAGRPGPELWVRINALDEGGLDDLAAVVRSAPTGIMVPKVDGPLDLVRLGHCLDVLERRDGVATPIRMIPVATETAGSSFRLGQYQEHKLPRLAGLTWGAEDLASAIGAATNRAPDGDWAFTYRLARSLCLLAAHACGVQAIETVHTDFRDEAGLRASSEAAMQEGFGGRMAIHPAQVPILNAAFMPSDADFAHAKRIIDAFAAAPDAGTVGLDGKMIDIPHLKQARKIVAMREAHAARA